MAWDKKNDFGKELRELKTALRRKCIERMYIFYGEETFLLHHYLGQIKKLLIEDLTESFNYSKFTKENFDIQAFADAVESLPMMAEHTMVCVDDVDIFKLPEPERVRLAEIFADIPEYCCVVFTYETTLWKPDKRLKKFYDSLMAAATVVEFPKQEQRDLIAWITRHFGANQKRISPELCSYLIDITGGTMTSLAGEISKICAYSEADTIVKSDIDAVTEPVLDAVVFQMTDLLGEGKYGAALAKLQQLLKMQEDPIQILGAIGGHIRRLGVARTMLDNGKTATDMMRLYNGNSEYMYRKIMATAKNFSPHFCTMAAELVMETDRQMKTSFDVPERLLELLLLRLSQEARND